MFMRTYSSFLCSSRLYKISGSTTGANETKQAEVGENEEDVHSFDMTLTGRRQIGSHSPARGVGPGAR